MRNIFQRTKFNQADFNKLFNKNQKLISRSELQSKVNEIAQLNGVKLIPREKAFLLSLFDSNTKDLYEVSKVSEILFNESHLDTILRKNKRIRSPFQESVIKPEVNDYIKQVEYRESFAKKKHHLLEEESKNKIQKYLINKNTNFYDIWKKMDIDKNKYISSNDIKSVLAKSGLFNQQNINYILNQFGNFFLNIKFRF